MITLKHGEVALVQVPAAWLPKRVNQEQRRINRNLEKQGVTASIIVVSGGPGDGSPLDIAPKYDDEVEEALAAG
jgi:hypothetical protein